MARSRFEIKCQKELEAEGWAVDYKMRPTRPNPHYNTDYFNIFDLLAYRAGDPLRMISIKGQAGVPSKHRQEIEDFFVPMGIQKEIWQYRKLKGQGNRFIPKKTVFTS